MKSSQPFGCSVLRYILDAQLFLQPQFLLHREQCILYYLCSVLSSYLDISAYFSRKENVTQAFTYSHLRYNVKRKLTRYSTASLLGCLGILGTIINLNYRTGANFCYVT